MRLYHLCLIPLLWLTGCSTIEQLYKPVDTVALQSEPVRQTTACDAATPETPPSYHLNSLRDCTAQDTMVMFAFSGGGIRSAAFGYGALQAAHALSVPDDTSAHHFDQDIDIVSGVSGGSFTAAAFASKREKLFPAAGAPDYYRDNFLTHNFFSDLLQLYLSPLHWRWLFPYYGTNDEMAEIYADIAFSGPSDKLFARNFGDLARNGRPMLVVQATDYGNEQPFTFTQNDFDLICSDLAPYPVGRAIAASSAFPVLFSPIQLTNHHFTTDAVKADHFCHQHRPLWIDRVLSQPEPEDISRLYTRAQKASQYIPAPLGTAHNRSAEQNAQYVHLQDGGAADNVALRGILNIVLQNFTTLEATAPWHDAESCRIGMNRVRRIVIVAVDGEAQPNKHVATLPYLSDLSLILDVTSSAMIDANGFETMLATDAMIRKLANKLSLLDCRQDTETPFVPQSVTPYFAHVSFQDLHEATPLPDGKSCNKSNDVSCTVDDLARSETSLDFSPQAVDALIQAGRSAFLCNRKVGVLLRDIGAKAVPVETLPCATGKILFSETTK